MTDDASLRAFALVVWLLVLIRIARSAFYGSAAPDFDFTSAISELLIAPLTVTS